MPDAGGKSSLVGGDISFMAGKEFDGKLFHEVSAEFSTTGVKISRIVPSGDTFYLAKAKLYPKDVAIRTSVGTATNECKCEVKFNGTVIDVMNHDLQSTLLVGGDDIETTQFGGGNMTETATIGLSMVGDGVDVVEINVTAVTGTYRVLLLGWEELTATDPRLI